MIDTDRFLASKNLTEHLWLEIRENGVSATEVASASTPAGFRDVIENRKHGNSVEDNDYMRFGRDQEPVVAMWLKDNHDIMPNDWSICHDINRHYRATPDGLSLDHKVISEIKTTGKDFDGKVPIRYMRQIQWQLYVTGADHCVFAWWLREDSPNGFIPGWLEPKTLIVQPDEAHIKSLIITAEQLWEGINA